MPSTPPSKKRKSGIKGKDITEMSPATAARREPQVTMPMLGTHVLFIFVGPQRHLVTLHSELLPPETRSYLKTQNEGHTMYQIPGEEVQTVELYRAYLYTGKIFTMSATSERSSDVDDRRRMVVDPEWLQLANGCLFGCEIRDERYANACIDALIEKVNESDRFPTSLAALVYEHSEPGHGLRKLIVDIHIWRGLGTGVRKPHDDADGPKDFLQDVLLGLTKAGASVYNADVTAPWGGKACRLYHTHEVTSRCKK